MADGSSKPQVPDCPVDSGTQRWIESSLRWFVDEFGAEALRRDVVLPSAAFLSEEGYSASEQEIEAIVTHICKHMMVGTRAFKLKLFDNPEERKEAARSGRKRAVGHFRVEEGQAIIDVDQSESADRQVLTAIVVHELCHLRLLGERRIQADRPDGERLTDLLAVFIGFGIFSTNAAMLFARSERGWTAAPTSRFDDVTLNAARREGYRRIGYLSSAEFGYALSCYCWLRREPAPGWAVHVNPGPRAHLDQGLAYLACASAEGELPTQRVLDKPIQVGTATVRVSYSTAASLGPASLMLPDSAVRPTRDDNAADDPEIKPRPQARHQPPRSRRRRKGR